MPSSNLLFCSYYVMMMKPMAIYEVIYEVIYEIIQVNSVVSLGPLWAVKVARNIE